MPNSNQQNEQEQNKVSLDFAKLSKLIIKDLQQNLQASRKYKTEDIQRFIDNPSKNEKQLRDISRHLYNVSPHYKRLINYFAKMLTFDYIIEPYNLNTNKLNKKTFLSGYEKVLNYIDNMNIKHEMVKVMTTIFREDVFYGYEHMTGESYFIQPLNSDYCRISSIEDGVFCFEFDFSYFDKVRGSIDNYAQEFKTKYNAYKKDSSKRWQELDSMKTICIKVNDDINYAIPPFSTIFQSVFELEDYKLLKKTKAELDNYAVLIQQIPMLDTKEADSFGINMDYVVQFHNRASDALPSKGVGLITTPMKVEAVKFNTNNNTTTNDNVSQAVQSLYEDAGVSQVLFNSSSATGTGVQKSIQTDELITFGVLRQIERWINRKLKQLGGTYKFKINFLDITYYNRDDLFDKYLKAGQYGVPVKLAIGSVLGYSPSAMNNMLFLEDSLGLIDLMRPLSSSHTQNGDTEGGRPLSDNLSPNGEKARDNETNDR